MNNPKYYKRYDVPYQCTGSFINGDLSLIIHGSMKDLDKWRSLGVVLGGRFRSKELMEISKDEADKLLKDKFQRH